MAVMIILCFWGQVKHQNIALASGAFLVPRQEGIRNKVFTFLK
jgi:hypothetical protein